MAAPVATAITIIVLNAQLSIHSVTTAAGSYVRTACLLIAFFIIEAWPYAQWMIESNWPEGRSTVTLPDGSIRDPVFTPSALPLIVLYTLAVFLVMIAFLLFFSLTPVEFSLQLPVAIQLGLRDKDIARAYGMGVPRRNRQISVASMRNMFERSASNGSRAAPSVVGANSDASGAHRRNPEEMVRNGAGKPH